VSSSPKSDVDSDVSKIAAVRAAWIEAVKSSDVSRLADLGTDDVVAVRGTGRCACGKEEFKAELMRGFAMFDAERTVLSSEVIVRDNWAIEIDEMGSTVTPVRVGDGVPVYCHLRVVVIFARQSDSSWKVARVMELLD
jgi:ketosteroid isomerase-like protein